MKDATGELSTTVIAVVAIAAIAAIFTVVLLPQMKRSIILGQACSNGPGYTYNGEDYQIVCDGGKNFTQSAWNCKYTQTGVGGEITKQCKQ